MNGGGIAAGRAAMFKRRCRRWARQEAMFKHDGADFLDGPRSLSVAERDYRMHGKYLSVLAVAAEKNL